jgi:hypothetical protein
VGLGAGFYHLSIGVKYLGEPAPTGLVKMWDKIYGKRTIALFIHPRQSTCICGEKSAIAPLLSYRDNFYGLNL